MLKAYKEYWKGYIDFKGRTDIGGYWWAFLANFIINFVLSFISAFFGRRSYTGLNTVYATFVLICILPSLAVTVRRLRDAGQSWLNMFWALLPIAGYIILLVKLCKPASYDSHSYRAVNRTAAENGAPLYRTCAPARTEPASPAPRPEAQAKPGRGSCGSFRKVPISSLKSFAGSGVCDVCNCTLSGKVSYIVPNNIFYSSPEWREHFKQLNSVMFGLTGRDVEQGIERMRMNDSSPGSAVCSDCIHMFAE